MIRNVRWAVGINADNLIFIGRVRQSPAAVLSNDIQVGFVHIKIFASNINDL